jgi:uncharacterized protein (DUF4415 family)
MTFEWDEQKRLANLARHGIDFAMARLIFAGPTLEFRDDRRDYGETRIGAYGEVSGVVLLVVYTRRGVSRRLISASKAGTQMNEKSEKSTTHASLPETPAKQDETDWRRVEAMTDADITQAVADDPDTFIPDAQWIGNARIVTPQAKAMVTLRLDPDVLAWFKQGGRGYQTRINAVLRAFVEAHAPARR